MRKNTARHWLHACLDLLPVLLIPVFMIYSHRHSLTDRTNVDIQYKYETNEVNSVDDWLEGHIYDLDLSDTNNYNNLVNYVTDIDYLYVYFIHSETIDLSIFNFNNDNYILNISYVNNELVLNSDEETYNIVLSNTISIISEWDNDDLKDSGIVLSISTYNEIESVVVEDTNSDIMSVFMDNFNSAVDKYFNMGNVFNMNNVYQWFNTNIFGGNAPVVIYSVWNIVLYEFVMDLLFLLYGLFMWFIDMCKRLMDKPLDSIK